MPNDRQRQLRDCAKYHEDFARGVSARTTSNPSLETIAWCDDTRDRHLAWARACRNDTAPDPVPEFRWRTHASLGLSFGVCVSLAELVDGELLTFWPRLGAKLIVFGISAIVFHLAETFNVK